MKTQKYKKVRSRRALSLVLILVLTLCMILPPVEGRAAQNDGSDGTILPEEETMAAPEEESPEEKEEDISADLPQNEGDSAEEDHKDPSEDGQELTPSRKEEGGEEETREDGEEAPADELSEGEEAGEEEDEVEEEDLTQGLLLRGAESVPGPLGNVTVGSSGQMDLPVSSDKVGRTRYWYAIHNNVKYWAVCARASSMGPVAFKLPDSDTVACRYNYLNEEAVNGIAEWLKSGERISDASNSTVPIVLNLGSNSNLAKAVMVSMLVRDPIWEDSFSSFPDTFAAAHLLVSYLLFGDDNACGGENYDLVFHQMETKVRNWLRDPANAALCDSCTAYIAYLWNNGTATGRQPIVWVEGVPGLLDLHKSAVDQDGTPVSDMDLSGTTYTLYTDQACSSRARDAFGKDAVFVCDSEGNAPHLVLPAGTYFLKETKAAPGMELDEEVHRAEVALNTPYTSLNYQMKETQDVKSSIKPWGSLQIQKKDSVTGSVQGGASLKGAVYELIVDQEEGISCDKGTFEKGDVFGLLTTDEDGEASLSEIPEGAYILREKSPSEGYKLTGGDRKIRIEKDKTLMLTGEAALPEDIIRAPFSFEKKGSGDQRMAGVSFRVTCRETGDSWEIQTGEDGSYDSMKEEDPARQKPVYGTYLLEELPCSANEGYRLCEPATFTVGGESRIDLGTFVNYRNPSVETRLTDEKGDKYVRASGELTLKDNIFLHDMYDYKGKEILIRGKLMDKETGREAASAQKRLTVTSAEEEAVMEFVLDASFLSGKSLTAFEYVYDKDGKEIAKHENMEDEEQTVYFPSLQTRALCPETGDQVLPSSGQAVVKDIISYRALEGGKTYRAEGILYDAESGNPFTSGGREVKSSVTFTADASGEGSVTAEFSFDLTGDRGGKILVAAETLYDSRGEILAEHRDMQDKAQTIFIPEIGTKAQDLMTRDHAGTVSEKTVLRDKVTYKGLSTEADYEISGTLMLKESGEPLLVNGEKVTSSRTFRPEASEGTVFLDFTFDSRALAGKTVVCFEELRHKDISVCVHADLEDESQSVVYPAITTSACDIKSRDHLGIFPAVEVKDRASVTGLIPGYSYRVRGVLYDREKKEKLTGKDGKEITTEKEFTASAEQETIELSFRAESALTGGVTVVVCEELIHNDVVTASHNDLEDEEQSVHYPEIRTSAEDAATKSHVGAAVESAVVKDMVCYSNLIPSTKEKPVHYTIKGTLMKKSSGEPLLDREGREISVSKELTPENPSGQVELVFTFDASLLQGETVVCFENLYREDLLAAVHADLEDREQSVYYPSVSTSACDEKTGSHTGAAGEENTLTDLVSYRNLVPGDYVIRGTVTDSATGLPFMDEDGKKVTSEKTFTASEMSGQVPVTFTFRAGSLAGRSLTVFETLCTKDGTVVVVHEDSEDKDQMIFYPEITTEAEDALTGTHTGPVKEEVTVIDHVYYKKLIPSTPEEPREYTVRGVLMVRSTGEMLLDENGEAVSAELTFSPEESDGCADLVFTFSSELLAGETVVCFETLYENDIEVTAHADLEDERQSIYYPSIRTLASVNGGKKAAARGKVKVEDLVEYRNLVPGTEYELKGTLMDKATGKPMTVKGKQVTAGTRFVPEEADGSVVMSFSFDASGLGERTLVVFETLYVNEIETAVHADPEDEKQSILLTPPSNPPKTGDRAGTGLLAVLFLTGLAGICIFGRHKSKGKVR